MSTGAGLFPGGPPAAPGAGPHEEPPFEGPEGGERGPESQPWSWLFVRVSGALLVLLAGAHLTHRFLVGDPGEVTALAMVSRWSGGWWRLVDFAFVALATGHALVGTAWAVRRRLGEGTASLVLRALLGTVLAVLGVLAALSVLTVR